MSAPTADPLPRVARGVTLRRLSDIDLPQIQSYRSDPELGRYQGWSSLPESEARAFLDEMSGASLFRPGKWVQIAIADPESHALLGDIGLFLATDLSQAEIGFTLSRNAQGRGLATAAVRQALKLIFELTAVERVVGITDARNVASIRLLERVGMVRQEERDTEFRGESCVEYVYALVRNDG